METKYDYLNNTVAVELDKDNRPFLKAKDPKVTTDLILGGLPWVLTQKFGSSPENYEISRRWCISKIQWASKRKHID